MDIRKKFVIAVAMAAVAAPASAANLPATAAAGAKALLLIPLTLTKVDDLDFGSVVSSNTSGTIALNASTGVRTFAGGVTGIPSAAGHVASFAGAGTPNQQVVLVIVPPAQLSDGAGHTIDVLALTLDNNGNPIRTIDSTHSFIVDVGGILNVNANQVAGLYSATFQVIANYE